jgi:hypothetical protein
MFVVQVAIVGENETIDAERICERKEKLRDD